jgi:hypothetical protein
VSGRVDVPNNWSPPTAVNRTDRFNGDSKGFGALLGYSFTVKPLNKRASISFETSIGYFAQRFNLTRPFDYKSPLDVIFYTDYYTYHCFDTNLGIGYTWRISDFYSLMTTAHYHFLYSFLQVYEPAYNTGTNNHKQTNHRLYRSGDMALLSASLERQIAKRFSIGFSLLVPLQVRWRNDRIFRDDPTGYSKQGSGIGFSIYGKYRFGK